MTLEKTLRALALGSIFALPFVVFIVMQSLFFPFITGKNFVFRILVEIAVGSYLALALVNPLYRPRRSWLLGAFAAFVLIVALADALGAYPFKSFWSNFERMDGWITLAHLFLYFVVASSILNTEKLWKTLWYITLGVSVAIGLYGLLQLAGFVSLNPGFSSAARIDATFGNPIYLAVYMLFHIGIAGILWARAWAESIPGKRVSFSVLYGGIIVFNTIILLLTGTRGAMLGLGAGVVFGAIVLAFTSRESRRLALSVIGGFVLLAGAFLFVRDAAWIQHVPFLERLATISLNDKTTQARFMNWGMAWEGVKERPLLGWGQENYAIVFDKYYNPQMYGQEQWFDRVHNSIFDWLIAAGFLGLFGYLSLFIFAFFLIWRRDAFNPYEKSILAGILVAYFFHNLFVFDNIVSYLLFATVLAYIAWRGSRSAQELPMPRVSPRALPIIAACAVVLVWGTSWYVNGRSLAENRLLLEALRPQEAGLEKNLEYMEKAISYQTIGTQEAREQLLQASAQIARIESVPLATKQKFFDVSTREMLSMIEEAPLNARFPLFLGVLLTAYGDYKNGEQAFEKAHELSPGKQTILFELAANQFAQGNLESALATYKMAFELAPEFLDARLYYAAVAIHLGKDTLAEELLAPLAEEGGAADQRIAAAYVSRGRFDKIIEIWKARVAAQPDDAQAYLTLAAAYYEAGNAARAIEVLTALGATIPDAKEQSDALIEQVRSGTIHLE